MKEWEEVHIAVFLRREQHESLGAIDLSESVVGSDIAQMPYT